MLRINEGELKKCDAMCGGATYVGHAKYDGETVKEVLDEIREFTKDKRAAYLGDDFGNPIVSKYSAYSGWAVYINDDCYWSGWMNVQAKKYNKSLDKWIVDDVFIDGGWYSYYDFTIRAHKKQNPIFSYLSRLFRKNREE